MLNYVVYMHLCSCQICFTRARKEGYNKVYTFPERTQRIILLNVSVADQMVVNVRKALVFSFLCLSVCLFALSGLG